MRRFPIVAMVLVLGAGTACGPTEEAVDGPWVSEGRDDSWSGGVPDPGNDVWIVRRAWTDTAPNGETYEEYYATWLAGIQHDGRGRDVRYTLADGTVVPAPSIECADTALSLRFIFAMEQGLPMFVSAGNAYFGHFGWVDRAGGRVRSYSRYSVNAPRGSDSALAQTARYLPNDTQDWPYAGATIGAYMDAAFTNKRFGYFMQDLWNMVYSGNLAENANTFFLRPEHIRGGDLQLHRYDNSGGIGHTITIQMVERSETGRLLDVDIIQSYMPTKPWIGDGYSELTGYTPDPSTGAGLRRWRRPVLSDGRWYLVGDATVAASARDVPGNPERFAELFGMSAADEVRAMVETINTRRRALFDNPNSCRRREEREAAFASLYGLYARTPELYRELGFSAAPSVEQVRTGVDRLHRTVDDFVWAALSYEGARTCHWNPSDPAVNNDMYRATMAFNLELLEVHGCRALRVFRAEEAEYCAGRDGVPANDPASCSSVPDGFQDLRGYAEDKGYRWAGYRNDEGGSLASVGTDALAAADLFERFCEIHDELEAWTQP